MGWWPCGGCECPCAWCDTGTTPKKIEIVLATASNIGSFALCYLACANLSGTYTLSQKKPVHPDFDECCYWESPGYTFPFCRTVTLRFGKLFESSTWRFWIDDDDVAFNSDQIDFDPTTDGGAEWVDNECNLELTYTTAQGTAWQGSTCFYPSGTTFTFTPL